MDRDVGEEEDDGVDEGDDDCERQGIVLAYCDECERCGAQTTHCVGDDPDVSLNHSRSGTQLDVTPERALQINTLPPTRNSPSCRMPSTY